MGSLRTPNQMRSGGRKNLTPIHMKQDDGGKRGLGRQTVVRQKPMVNHKSFDKIPYYKSQSLPMTMSADQKKLKPAPNALKIYNEF